MALKPGDMADAIETAFQTLWPTYRPDEPFPSDSVNERRLLFLAIAQGILTYLNTHEDEMFSTIDLSGGGLVASTQYNVDTVDLDVNLS
jgi:hypothetical protein